MLNPFRALGSSLRDLFDDFLLLIMCNLLWAAISLPLWAVAFTLLSAGAPALALVAAVLGVLPAGPATIALYHVAYRITDGRAVKVGEFFGAMREHARIGIILTGITIAGLVLILFNLGFYLSVNNAFGGAMLGLWIYLLVFWLGLALYVFPLAFLQDAPDLRLIVRNAFLMSVGRPIFTFLTLLLMGVIVGLSLFLVVPAVLITVAFLTVWATRATRQLIDDARRRREEAEAGPGDQAVNEKGRKGQVRPK
jgi:uncharacterized membrane protein YesL